MKRLVLSLAALGVLAIFSAPATASDFYYSFGRQIARDNHARHHDDLDHRAFHRELDHREAHRHPMTHRQHDRLHDVLDHDAFHDELEHRAAHRSGAYYPRRGITYDACRGFGYQGRGFSIWLGH